MLMELKIAKLRGKISLTTTPPIIYLFKSPIYKTKINSTCPTLTSLGMTETIHSMPRPREFTLDLESIMQLGSNIMCGDFNTHHQDWKCSTNRPRGKQLLKSANQTDLDIIAPTNQQNLVTTQRPL
ncbi:hypothetical protein CDAR_305391 [Caerostris darwini]|uniref:Endonuclease/exonuclease/phosphatase domain-containing protein n=1 Tax=Caerostris darwini TaxID=1538125 RepID=A0AAV4MC66_9ARAC|nr:hypothetical protein CDAR_305391 [Caerostris darwini]